MFLRPLTFCTFSMDMQIGNKDTGIKIMIIVPFMIKIDDVIMNCFISAAFFVQFHYVVISLIV